MRRRQEMIKTILVPSSGNQTDESVFATAATIGRPLRAHLDFYHIRFSPFEAAIRTPHVDFCVGGAMDEALDYLQKRQTTLAEQGQQRYQGFCEARSIAMRTAPDVVADVTASWDEDTDNAEGHLVVRARHSDLVVLGRPQHRDLMPNNLIAELLLGCGRPIVIAPDEGACHHSNRDRSEEHTSE